MKTIADYPSYKITEDGGVWSSWGNGRWLKPVLVNTGYLSVTLHLNTVPKNKSIHRLVALAFVDGFEEGLTVNHINGIKTDNRAVNLEWVTLSENNQHAKKFGLNNCLGSGHHQSKLTEEDICKIRNRLEAGETCAGISRDYPVNRGQISKIKHKKQWVHVHG